MKLDPAYEAIKKKFHKYRGMEFFLIDKSILLDPVSAVFNKNVRHSGDELTMFIRHTAKLADDLTVLRGKAHSPRTFSGEIYESFPNDVPAPRIFYKYVAED